MTENIQCVSNEEEYWKIYNGCDFKNWLVIPLISFLDPALIENDIY